MRGASAQLRFPNRARGGESTTKRHLRRNGREISVLGLAPQPLTLSLALLSESLGETGPLPSPAYPDPAAPLGEADPAQGPCPHLNGGLKAAGPPRRDSAKRRPCCQGDGERDVVLLATPWPCHEEHGHGFPLPATELGATALVTTKTTQDCMGEERP